MGDLILKAFLIFLVISVLIGVIGLASGLSTILIPISMFISKVVGFIVKPLTALWELCMKGIRKLKELIFKDKSEILPSLGGLGLVIWMVFCVAVIVFTAIYIVTKTEDGVRELDDAFMRSLPIFCLLNWVIDGVFSINIVFEFALFSLIAVSLMRGTQELHIVLRVVYDLIFTFFTTCILFWLPDGWYSFTIDAIKNLPQLADVLDDLHIFGFIVLILVLLIIVYLTVVFFSITIRELMATLAFALIPFAIMIVVIVVLGTINFPKWLFDILGYGSAVVLSLVMSYMRVSFEEDELD